MKKILSFLILTSFFLLYPLSVRAEEAGFYSTLALPDQPSEQAIQGMYTRIFTEVDSFVERQTKLEMKRYLEFQKKTGVAILPLSSLNALVDFGCLDKNEVSSLLAEGKNQTVSSILKNLNEYQAKCVELRNLNKKFIKPFSVLSYKTMFMNGNTDDSSFDLLRDVNMLKRLVDSSIPTSPATWNTRVSEDVEFLLGSWFKPQYEEVQKETVAQLQSKISFKEGKIPLGMCLRSGGETYDSTFSEAEKNSIAKNFARFQQDKATADPAQDQTAVMTKSGKTPGDTLASWLSSAATWNANVQAQLGQDQCASGAAYDASKTGGSASACIKVEFVPGDATERSMNLSGDVQMSPSLMTVLAKLRKATEELSHQDLQTKNEPRSIFSIGWQDFKFSLPTNPIEISFVPVVPVVDQKEFRSKRIVQNLLDVWKVLIQDPSATTSTVQANTSLSSGIAVKTQEQSVVDDKKSLAEALSSRQMDEQYREDLEKNAGAQLEYVISQFDLMLRQVRQLKEQSAAFRAIPKKTN